MVYGLTEKLSEPGFMGLTGFSGLGKESPASHINFR
jgi:hypothetical protein